jgi:N-acyl-D-aspartate/D-glutamate deacylase
MPYALVIKSGVLIDGATLPRHCADIAVRRSLIATISRIREVIDPDALVVGPGLIDGHPHRDANPLGNTRAHPGWRLGGALTRKS